MSVWRCSLISIPCCWIHNNVGIGTIVIIIRIISKGFVEVGCKIQNSNVIITPIMEVQFITDPVNCYSICIDTVNMHD